MKITVPKDLGGDLKVLPPGPCKGAVEGISVGKSQTGQPKATVRWIVLSELYPKGDKEHTSVGERVLDTFSLQEQALWNLNAFYKEATGENLPQGDYDEAEMQVILEDALKGSEFNLILGTEMTPDGEEQTRVQERKVAK